MVYHVRTFGYGSDYQKLFEGLRKMSDYVNSKYPDVNMLAMYNLAGERGKVSVVGQYATLGDYERIDSELDNDEKFGTMLGEYYELLVGSPVDQFYRTV